MIYGCDVCACELICHTAVGFGEDKSLTAVEDMECKYSCCEVEVLMNFRLEKKNSVVREIPCTSCKILLGNPEKFGDFYRGLITGSFIPPGIKLYMAGDFMETTWRDFAIS